MGGCVPPVRPGQPIGRDALDLVAPLAGRLDGGLDRLGAGVHRQDGLHGAQLGQRLAEGAETVMIDGAAGQGDPLQLRAGGLEESRVPVAEVHRRVGHHHVEVAAAVVVVVGDVALGQLDRLVHGTTPFPRDTDFRPLVSRATAGKVRRS
jgi:hypothetical protein